MNYPEPVFRKGENSLWPYLICVLVSIALFTIALYTDDIINDDGIDYIYAAYEYSQGNAAAALSFRPEQLFYGHISILAKNTGLSLLQSAYFSSILSQIALMCGFLAIIRALGGSVTTQLLAIVVIASMVHFNELRPHIIKGFGFWACQVWALWALIKFAQISRWRYLFCWAILGGISILFRIEGIAYLVGMTLLIPFILAAKARNRFLLSGVIMLTGALAIASVNHLYSSNVDQHPAEPSIKLEAELLRAKDISRTLSAQKELIRDTMPNKWARDSASNFLIGGLLLEVVSGLFFTTNTFLLVLVLAYGRPRLRTKAVDHRLIASYFMIGLLISFYTVTSRFFITDRYLFLPALLLCIPIPFLLRDILYGQNYHSRVKHLALCGSILIIPLLAIIAPLIKDDDAKMYIPQAATWLENNLAPAENIYYNDQKLAFYSGDYANRSFQMQEVSLPALRHKDYAYAVIHTTKSRPLEISARLADEENIELLHSILGQPNGRIDVYKILAPRK